MSAAADNISCKSQLIDKCAGTTVVGEEHILFLLHVHQWHKTICIDKTK